MKNYCIFSFERSIPECEFNSKRFLEKLGNHSSVYAWNLGSNQALSCHLLSQVVRRPIKANPGLNFNLGFFFFCSKAFSRIIFSILFRASNHQIVGKRIKLNLLLKSFLSEFKFRTNPGLS